MPIKKPLHPGRVADHLFQAEGYESDDIFCCECLNGQKLHTRSNLRLISEKMNYPRNVISRLVCGDKEIDYFLAYKLVKILPQTSMEFWLSLQQMYDDFKNLGPLDENECNAQVRVEQKRLQEEDLKENYAEIAKRRALEDAENILAYLKRGYKFSFIGGI